MAEFEIGVYVGILAAQIVIGIEQLIQGSLNDHEHDIETQFTQDLVDGLRKQYPNLNVMVVHPNHTQTFTNVTHQHYELPLTWPRTQGYEVYLFPAGEFWLQGDGGFLKLSDKPDSWCFDGNYVRDSSNSNHVTFSDPTPVVVAPPPPPPPAPTPVTDGVYMVNSVNGTQQSSGFAWYAAIANTINQPPGAYVDIAQGVYFWEGRVSSMAFQDGNVFTCFIAADAHTQAVGALVGTAKNNFRSFQVFKDDHRVIYTADGWEVRTVYYAQ